MRASVPFARLELVAVFDIHDSCDSLFDCPLGRVAHDPYSPLFVLDDSTAGDDPTISAIIAAADWPDAATTLLC